VTGLYNEVFLSNEKYNQNSNGIRVYPNPAKERIFIDIPNSNLSIVTATLSDITGKIILKEKIVSDGNGHFTLNIENNKTAGIYILNVSGENLNTNFKVVVE